MARAGSDDTTRIIRNSARRFSDSSARVKRMVRDSLSVVSAEDSTSSKVVIDVAINAGCDVVAKVREGRFSREIKALKLALAESQASEQVFRAEVTRLRDRLGEWER